MGFKLGTKSKGELIGVHHDLVDVVERAIQTTSVDFSVHDGVRTLNEQKELVRLKASKTLKSRHLVQPDGLGHAVDLVPYINGKLRWEWPACYHIALAVNQSAYTLGVDIRWGGVWDKPLSEYGGNAGMIEDEVEAYVKRMRIKHPTWKSIFIDGPHFDIIV